jgi:hypothetical protein
LGKAKGACLINSVLAYIYSKHMLGPCTPAYEACKFLASATADIKKTRVFKSQACSRQALQRHSLTFLHQVNYDWV